MSLFDLTGKTAVITGSSRGIGKSIAEQMAEQGARVVISSRKPGPCQDVADALNAKHGDGTAIAIPANISSKDDLKNLTEKTRAEFGQIDILVCNAASNPYYGHWLIQLVAPEMKERKDGAIVIISSIGGLKGSSTIGAYNISKAADFQLARNYALELGPHNIRVNCVAPGLIKTDFARALWENPEMAARVEKGTPMRRIGDPEDIAGAAVFLASKAGAYMAGQMVVVDGGSVIV